MKRCLLALALALCIPCYGQTTTTSVLVAQEGDIIVSSTAPNATYKFGVDGTLTDVPNPVTYPLKIDCTDAAVCRILGGDPATGLKKNLYAVQQTSTYTVTLASGKTVAIPALPPVVIPQSSSKETSPCLPTPSNQSVPVAPKNCAIIPGGIAVGNDGALLVMAQGNGEASSVYLQYCQGTVCNPPFVWLRQPLLIGPGATFGGPTGGTGVGTLYIFPSTLPVVIITSAGLVQTSTIPASK